MNFKSYVENLDSPEFGKFAAKKMADNNPEVDGDIFMNFVTQGEDCICNYEIKDASNKIIKVGSVNDRAFPEDLIIYVVYKIAEKHGVYHPSNCVIENETLSGCGVAQPTNYTPERIDRFKTQLHRVIDMN